jgi:hypothetical protein
VSLQHDSGPAVTLGLFDWVDAELIAEVNPSVSTEERSHDDGIVLGQVRRAAGQDHLRHHGQRLGDRRDRQRHRGREQRIPRLAAGSAAAWEQPPCTGA